MRKFLMCLVVLLAPACAHKLETASDLRLNEVYPMVGNPAVSKCTIKAQNILTVMPSPMGPLPIEVAGTKAMICGEIDCSAMQPGAGSPFDCVPMELLQQEQSSSSKSE